MSHHIADTPSWTSRELDRIGAGEELRIAWLRPDGTLRQPVTVWGVRQDSPQARSTTLKLVPRSC